MTLVDEGAIIPVGRACVFSKKERITGQDIDGSGRMVKVKGEHYAGNDTNDRSSTGGHGDQVQLLHQIHSVLWTPKTRNVQDLRLYADGSPSLELFDKEGKTLILLPHE